jgi:hypothetical protein
VKKSGSHGKVTDANIQNRRKMRETQSPGTHISAPRHTFSETMAMKTEALEASQAPK